MINLFDCQGHGAVDDQSPMKPNKPPPARVESENGITNETTVQVRYCVIFCSEVCANFLLMYLRFQNVDSDVGLTTDMNHGSFPGKLSPT